MTIGFRKTTCLLVGSLLLGSVGCSPPGETTLPKGGCKPPQVGKLQTLEFSASTPLTTIDTGASLGVATSDFDGDSYPDLVVSQSADGSVGVLLGRGDGTFKDAVRYASGRGASVVVARDLDGDGRADVAVANTMADEVAFLRGGGDGTFESAAVNLVGLGPNSLAPGDFDGDGKLDLAVGVEDTRLNLLRGEGPGRFTAPTGYQVFSPQRSVVGANLNSDSELDVAFLHGLNPEVRVMINDGAAAFEPMRILVLPSLGTQMAAADVDRDGKTDLLVIHGDLMQVTLLRGQGDGTFQMPTAIPLEKQPVAFTVADVDGDGVLDVVALSTDGVLSVLRGGGDGSFSAAVSLVATDGPRGLATGDWNCDGKMDVAVVGMTPKNNLRIVINRGR